MDETHSRLARLIAPLTVDQFFDAYWQKEIYVANRNSPVANDWVCRIDDIDELLSDVALPATQVNLGQSAEGVSMQIYSRGDYIDGAQVLRLHRSGKTIIIRAAHLWLPKVRELCEHFSGLFHCETQANLYLTPAGTHSSYPHWDAHDIFVIQLAGSKRWLLYESHLEYPLPSYRFDRDRHSVGECNAEFVVHSGDLAYVPRGAVHHPLATDYSVHIALGVLVKTWADLAVQMLPEIIARDSRLRKAMPVVANKGFDVERCLEEMPNLDRFLNDASLRRQALLALTREVEHGRGVRTRGQLNQFARAASVSLDTIVELPFSSLAKVETTAEECRILFNGAELKAGPDHVSALTFIKMHGCVRTGDIPGQSDAHRIALVQKLVDEGCLTIQNP
ncbi:JmjC domain-containing protein (plasmid) [Rhizobium etli bv. phaseoli str. IE4803]|nr:JmjC domain-containing protein [Rhizobium etli bv. phaseoli str. IE4803]